MEEETIDQKLISVNLGIDKLVSRLPEVWINSYSEIRASTTEMPWLSEMQVSFLALKGLLQSYVGFYQDLTVSQSDFKLDYLRTDVSRFMVNQKNYAGWLNDKGKQNNAKKGKLKDRRSVISPYFYLDPAQEIVTAANNAVDLLGRDWIEEYIGQFRKEYVDDLGRITFAHRLKSLYKEMIAQVNILAGQDAMKSFQDLVSPVVYDFVRAGDIEYVRVRDYGELSDVNILALDCNLQVNVTWNTHMVIRCLADEAVVPTNPLGGVIELVGKSEKDDFNGAYELEVPFYMNKIRIIGSNNGGKVGFKVSKTDAANKGNPLITYVGLRPKVSVQEGYEALVSFTERNLESELSLFSYR